MLQIISICILQWQKRFPCLGCLRYLDVLQTVTRLVPLVWSRAVEVHPLILKLLGFLELDQLHLGMPGIVE